MAQKILDKIVRPQYRAQLLDWQKYTGQNERVGLQIIGQIYRSKGNAAINIVLPQQKIMYQTHQSLMNRKGRSSLQQAQQKFRRKQLTTSYQYFHGYSLGKPTAHSNIFEHSTLQKLQLAHPLTAIAVSFIDNWLRSKDRKQYQKYVLACLRAVKSRVMVSQAGSTEMKTMYNWKEDANLSRPLRMDKIGEDLFVFKPNLQAIRRQEEKQRKIKERVAEIQKTDFAKQIAIYKDFKIN